MRTVHLIDRLASCTAVAGACLVIPLFSVMFYEVVLRFVFDLPTFWAYEVAYMLTGAHFALGIAYVLREGRHVRVDFIYARLSGRTRAIIDFTVYAFFLWPLMMWLSWALFRTTIEAYRVGEVSGEAVWNPLMWPLYFVVAVGFTVFTAQIFAECLKAISRIRPSR